MWGYPISYTREWELGFAQRRIDQLCDLLPIQDAGTVRIDAFHSCVPLLEDASCVSPYLGISSRQEAETQKRIISYFRTKGVDVTGEFSTRFRVDPLIGMQPMATHYNDIDILKVPASLYCGGDGGDPRVGFNMDGKKLRKYIMESEDMSDFVGEFAKSTLIWYYLNRLERLAIDKDGAVLFESGVRSWVEETEEVRQADEFAPEQLPGKYYVKKGEDFLREADDVFVPALWADKTVIAHSDGGYRNRVWRLPEDWPESGQANVSSITVDGLKRQGVAEIKGRAVSLTLSPGQSLAITL